jgi:hypothetical protein
MFACELRGVKLPKFEDFSKDALVRLLRTYRTIFVGLMGMWNTVNRDRMSVEDAVVGSSRSTATATPKTAAQPGLGDDQQRRHEARPGA